MEGSLKKKKKIFLSGGKTVGSDLSEQWEQDGGLMHVNITASLNFADTNKAKFMWLCT